MAKIPGDLVVVLSDWFSDLDEVRALWSRAGGEPGRVPHEKRPRVLWTQLMQECWGTSLAIDLLTIVCSEHPHDPKAAAFRHWAELSVDTIDHQASSALVSVDPFAASPQRSDGRNGLPPVFWLRLQPLAGAAEGQTAMLVSELVVVAADVEVPAEGVMEEGRVVTSTEDLWAAAEDGIREIQRRLRGACPDRRDAVLLVAVDPELAPDVHAGWKHPRFGRCLADDYLFLALWPVRRGRPVPGTRGVRWVRRWDLPGPQSQLATTPAALRRLLKARLRSTDSVFCAHASWSACPEILVELCDGHRWALSLLLPSLPPEEMRARLFAQTEGLANEVDLAVLFERLCSDGGSWGDDPFHAIWTDARVQPTSYEFKAP